MENSSADQFYKELKNNNKEQFNQLFTDFYVNLCRFAYTYVKDNDIAEEIVQEIFISLWEKRQSIVITTSVRSFLYTSIKNKALNYIRNEKTRISHEHEFAREQAAKFSQIINFCEREELTQLIDQAIAELPEQCRTIFEMSRNDGLTYHEIAQRMSLSPKSVENQMGIALKKLRTKLAPYLTLIFTVI
jgi:RNA polymerase sigma-70 factor, ECF subfamily